MPEGDLVNKDSTNIGADSTSDGTGWISFQTRQVDRFRIENDGTIRTNLIPAFNIRSKVYDAPNDGIADATAEIQGAIDDAAAVGAATVYAPIGTYKTGPLILSKSVTLRGERGSILKAVGGSPNDLFHAVNTLTNSTGLTTALQGALTIVVSSATGYVIGDRIFISGGTYTGSGSEEGPIEFNTITNIAGTTFTLSKPLKLSYSAFGLAGASPRVARVGPASTIMKDIRITGFTIQPNAGFNGPYLNLQWVENVEVDCCLFDGVGAAVNTGGYVSNLNYHDNILRGTPLNADVAMNFAGLTDSRIINNICNSVILGTSSADNNNSLNLEVLCYNNLIANNHFGPIRGTAGVIDINKYGFNNSIINNMFWGSDGDIQAGVSTQAIRTYAQGTYSGNAGNIIKGNRFHNIMIGIGDALLHSIISDNIHINDSLHANSIGIITDSGTASVGLNRFKNIANELRDTALTGTPRINDRFPATTVKAAGSQFEDTTPATITANQNNYNPGAPSKFQRWASNASRDVTGLTFTPTQGTGQEHVIFNIGGNDIVLKHESGSSTAANRFHVPSSVDVTLQSAQAADVFYDGALSRWYVFKRNV